MQNKATVKTDGFAWRSRRYSRSRPIGLLAGLLVALVPLQAGDTAKLLDEILSAKPAGGDGAGGESAETAVFTLGDNAYRRGTAKEFQEC